MDSISIHSYNDFPLPFLLLLPLLFSTYFRQAFIRKKKELIGGDRDEDDTNSFGGTASAVWGQIIESNSQVLVTVIDVGLFENRAKQGYSELIRFWYI